MKLLHIAMLLCVAGGGPVAEAENEIDRVVERKLKSSAIDQSYLSALGVTRFGTTIPTILSPLSLDHRRPGVHVLLVGGLAGRDQSVDAVLQAYARFQSGELARGSGVTLSAVPIANPDGWASGNRAVNRSEGTPGVGYPPAVNAYQDRNVPESQYLWRWIGLHAPDLVVEVRAADKTAWRVPEGCNIELPKALNVSVLDHGDRGLAAALVKGKPADIGSVPAIVFQTDGSTNQLSRLIGMAHRIVPSPSAARKEIQRRLDRTPTEVAKQLAETYGHDLRSVVYIPAVALIGRLQLGDLTGDAEILKGIERTVEPYRSGVKKTIGSKVSGSGLSGHLIFGELAKRTNESRYVELVKVAADLGFDASGNMKPSMPAHNEMSDAVFMSCPILAQAGRLTGDHKYFDMLVRHLKFMQNLCLRSDGLYRHSPMDDTAWGRGNGFPALGLALVLTDMPRSYEGYPFVVDSLRNHLQSLVKHQDMAGAWHQVSDHEGSYRELTSTCMITFAMARGVQLGVLDRARYAPIIDKAWYAIRTRVAPDGSLVDVCTGTGKQKNLRAYLDRRAILGKDGRGGAMALLVATEIVRYQRYMAGR